jgi:two-component system sensor histidine kinase BaeS
LGFGVFSLLSWAVISLLSFILKQIFSSSIAVSPVMLIGAILILVINLFAVIFITIKAYQVVIKPISDLIEAANQVAEGDLSVRMEVPQRGQLHRVITAFNHMLDQLQHADELRQNLTADVAHELRNPLHIIQGNLEGIIDGVYPADKAHLEAVLEETHLLSRLITDLRTLSLAEAGQLPLHLETVNISELFTDLQTSFSGPAEAAGIDFLAECRKHPHKPFVSINEKIQSLPLIEISADPDRIDQAVGNLLINAIRHTPEGGMIRLTAEISANEVVIQVKDTGEGIPEDQLPYIFERFWKADPSRTHADGSGTGLGLAITKQLIQNHGGRIEVTSQPNHGTTFTIHFPLIEVID